MSGFVERVIEDWLTKSDERAYQLAFAAALSRSGHTVKYVSSHGTLEQGKDIISISRDKRVNAYQLKAGNVSVAVWRKIVDEVREAATVPVQLPGVPARVPHRAFLVSTGRVTDAVRALILAINHDHRDHGYAEIETIQLDDLIRMFTDRFDSFFPSSIAPLNDLVGLYLTDERGPQDKEALVRVLQNVVGEPSGTTSAARALSNVVVAAEFVAAPFRRSQNHISVIDTWVIAACRVLLLKERMSLPSRCWQHALQLCRLAIESAGAELLTEGLGRDDFIEGDLLIDSDFLPYRRLIALGYIGAVINSRCIAGDEVRQDSLRLLNILDRERPLREWGEGAWNYYLNIAIALRHTPTGEHAAEAIVASWIDQVCPLKAPWPKDPYWRIDDELSVNRQREESARQPTERVRISYTAAAALGLLVRRIMMRNTLKRKWKAISRYDLAQVVPAESWGHLRWTIKEGPVEAEVLPVTGSWAQLRAKAAAERSTLFADEESWLLPYFLCIYPHRTAPAFAGELDFLTSPPAFRKEWRS